MKKVKVNHQPEKGLDGHDFSAESDENELDIDAIGIALSQLLDHRKSRPVVHDGFDSDEANELNSDDLLHGLEERDDSTVDYRDEDEGPVRIIPFNMKEEEEDDITKDDIWLDGTTQTDIKKAREAAERKQKLRQLEEKVTSPCLSDIAKSLLEYVSETDSSVLSTISRIGRLYVDDPVSKRSQINAITDLCSYALDLGCSDAPTRPLCPFCFFRLAKGKTQKRHLACGIVMQCKAAKNAC